MIENQTPRRGFARRGWFQLKTFRSFVAAHFGQRECRHFFPITGDFISHLHERRLGRFVLGEAIILVVFAHDRRVNHRALAFEIDERFLKRHEILRACGPDAMLVEIIARGRGCPERQVGFILLVVNGLWCPRATGVLGSDGYQSRLRPFDQVIRFPNHQRFAARSNGAPPIPVQIDREIRSEQEKLFPVVRPQQIRIAHALLAERRNQNRFSAIERVPLPTVPAQGEINLFRHRSLFTFEGGEQITAPRITVDRSSRGQCHCQEYFFEVHHNASLMRAGLSF